MQCKRCGSLVNSGDKFCKACGLSLQELTLTRRPQIRHPQDGHSMEQDNNYVQRVHEPYSSEYNSRQESYNPPPREIIYVKEEKKKSYWKQILSGLASIILFFWFINSFMPSADDIPRKAQQNDVVPGSKINTTTKLNNTAREFQVGETAVFKNVDYTLTEVRDFTSAKADVGMKKIGVYLIIRNNSSSIYTVNDFDYKIKTSDGELLTRTILSFFYDDIKNLKDVKLASGGKTEGFICYEVPVNDPKLKLLYKENMFMSHESDFVFSLYK